jgi:predicted RNase H-like nuclease (RuvC/YqgF family)
LKQFIIEGKRLVQSHYAQLKELKSDYDDFYEYVDSVNHELEIYINHIPKFEKDSVVMFSDLFEESLIILSEQIIDKYSELRPAVNKMQVWSEKTDNLIAPARNKYGAFKAQKERVEELLNKTKEVIDTHRADAEQTWGWSKHEILPRIKAAARSFDRKKKDWDRLIERNWAEYNITRALSECENLIQFCEGKLFELTQAMEKVNEKQNKLDSKTAAVELLLQKNNSKLSQSDKHDIEALVAIAEQSPNYDFANRVLGYAHTMALRRASLQVRNEVTNIINVYSKGGPVFMDRVSNSGIISGAMKIIQQRKKKGHNDNEKKLISSKSNCWWSHIP